MINRVLGLKILFFLAIIFIVGSIFSLPLSSHAQYSYDYTQLEQIPGFKTSGNDLKAYIESIYQFGIWTVGIAAILMITIGGFMYLTSAGNTSKMDVAKRVVTDALIGLIVALLAYLILYVINPDLIKVNINMKQIGTAGDISTTPKGDGTTCEPACANNQVCKESKCVDKPKSGSGKCEPVTSGPCAPENLKGACSWDADQASSICNAESGGVESKASGVDICKDGKVFSYGLFQINLTCQCKNAFTPVKAKGCVNKACSVSDQSMYGSCVSTYSGASSNIRKACEIYKSQGWNGWGANSKCGF